MPAGAAQPVAAPDLQKREKKGIAKALLILCVVGNIGALGVFKYADLLIGTINGIAGSHLALLELALPIGISFYTFQALSYVIDVYRGTVAAQKNPITFGTYIALFPQLIAGPIVQYKTVEEQLSCRRETAAQFAAGIGRVSVGFGEKGADCQSGGGFVGYRFRAAAGAACRRHCMAGGARLYLPDLF